MACSFDEQLAEIVSRAKASARAHLCDGDTSSAVVWDADSEITIRLSRRGDEMWLLAGSGILLRFVAASDGEFDHEGIDTAIDLILRGEAIEYFGAAGRKSDPAFATGYRIDSAGGFSGGRTRIESLFQARLAGPMAAGRLDAGD